ncbi:MAG: hypothetical protein AAB933_02880 [Patescibacteria group bacterium]
MQKHAKRILVLTVGIIFILLGLVGLALPFLQGILFLIIGFLLVSLCFPQIRTLMKKHTEKHHRLHKTINKVEVWLAKFIGEV